MNALSAQLFDPIVTRIPRHTARRMMNFARAELSSMLDLHEAAALCGNRERAAMYIRHALDESRHARMFSQRSAELRKQLGQAPPPPLFADTDHLFERLGEIGFLAFVHRGERRAHRQFVVHIRQYKKNGDSKTAALLEAALADEQRHEAYTRELLLNLCGGEKQARAALRKAAAWEAWQFYRRAGRVIAGFVYTLLMSILYLALFPFSLLTIVLRRPRKGFQPPAL